jgi:uncharacterized protein (DUF433 family)
MERPTDCARKISDASHEAAEKRIHAGLSIDRHPLVHLRTGGSGLRRPALVGTRLYVWQVIDTVRAEDGDVAAAAEYFGLPERSVRAAIDYYAEFTEEIDAYRAEEAAFAERERQRVVRA